VHQLAQLLLVARGGHVVQQQRELRRDVRDARRVAAYAEAIVHAHEIVAGAADPVQAIADGVHDDLVAARVALAVLPRHGGRDVRQLPHERGPGVHPVPAVDEQAERRRRADRGVVGEEPRLVGVRIVGRQRQDAVRAGLPRPRRLLDRHADVAADARDDRHAAGGRVDRRPDRGLVLVAVQRVQLAGPARRDDAAERMRGHRRDVGAQPVDVERELFRERRDGKADHAGQARSEIGRGHRRHGNHQRGRRRVHVGSTCLRISA
jgi:hypothetical protein